jgi:tape measure domain-containing protein
MTDEADFTVRLIEQITGPARAAKRALLSLSGDFQKLQQSAQLVNKVTGRTPLGGNAAAGALSPKAAGGGGFGAGAMAVAFGGLIERAIEKTVELGLEIGKSAGELVMFGQNARLAFDQLAKHDVTGEQLFEHARALAVRFGLDVEDVSHSYQKFLALQFNPHQIDQMVRMGADLRVLGNTAEDVNGIFLALGQIKSKGRLMGQEMLQLEERGISGALVWEEVGKLMGGKSVDQVRKLEQQGKVTADIALEAIQAAVKRKLQENELGDAGAKLADTTIGGMLGRFKALAQTTGLDVLEKVTAPFTKMLGQGLSAFEGFVTSDSGKRTIDGIAQSLGDAAKFAGDFFRWFREGFGDTWDRLAEGARELGLFGDTGFDTTKILRTLAHDLGQLAAMAVGFGVAFFRVSEFVGGAAVAVYEFTKAALGGLLEQLGAVGGALASWWDDLAVIWDDGSLGMIDKAISLGANLVTGIAHGIASVPTLVYDGLMDVLMRGYEGAKDALGIHSPSRVFDELGQQTTIGYVQGLDRGRDSVWSAGYGLGEAASAGTSATTLDPSIYGPATVAASSSAGAPWSGPVGAANSSAGDRTINVTMNLQIDGAGEPEAVGRAAARESRRELESFFRHLEMEIG